MKIKALFIITLLFSFAGCEEPLEEVLVPAVPQIWRLYYPYEVGDKITFSNGAECMTFEVSEKYIDDKDTIVITDGVPHTSMWFKTKVNASSLCLTGRLDLPSSLNAARIQITFEEYGVSGLVKSHTFSHITTSNHTVIVFNNPNIIASETEESTFDIDNVVLSWETGIFSFYDSKNKEEWVLKEIK